jgi:hypothetical protein
MNTVQTFDAFNLEHIKAASEAMQAKIAAGKAAVGPTPFMRRASILIERGIPVAPLPPRTKAANTNSWQTLATADPAKLMQLNAEPDGNTAAVARAEAGGFCFFEVDAENYHVQIEQQTGKKFPETFLVSSTPGKGRGHFYFKHTPKSIALGNAQAKSEQGELWSFRADRRYVVGPLSVKEDGTTVYTVIKDVPVADCPDWLVDWIAANQVESKKTGHAELDDETPIVEGSRNSALASILGKARQVLAMDKEELLNYGLSVNQKRCVPPLPDSEVRTIANSIGRYEVKPPAPPVIMGGQVLGQTVPAPEQIEVREMETEPINLIESAANSLDYLPSTVLASTRLQDIFMDFDEHEWPLTLSLPALVTAGSVIIPPMPRREGLVIGDDSMVNLYTALIADVNAGKSQVTNWAARAIGIYEPPVGSHYFEGKWGSAEQMLKSLHRKQSSFLSKSVLINPDEWSHLFAKARIPDASFPTVMTTSFYRRNQIFTLGGQGGGKEYMLNLSMSFIGGIVEDEFDTVFGAGSLGGLYDRFLFGRAPDGFHWSYRECPFEQKKCWLEWNLKPVTIDPSVYEVVKGWSRENRGLGRVAEICVRIAVIYASLDGRPAVTGKDMEPLKDLALYQVGLRQSFRPNPGKNPDAVFANKALAWIQKYAGEWTSIAKLKQHTWRIEQDLGPAVAVRSLIGLARSGRIDLWLADNGSQPPSDYAGPRPRIGLVRRVK